MHKVLIIDDQASYVQSQIELAANMGIELEHIDNWEDARKVLEKDPSYFKAVIIDGKGKLTKNGKEEDGNHLTAATKWLDGQKISGKYIHYVINTGFIEEIKKWYDDMPLYSKLGQEKKMFQDLLETINKSENVIVEGKYKDVLEAFDNKILPERGRQILVSLLVILENKRTINKPFNSIRDILEMVCKAANQIDSKLCPNDLIDKAKSNKPNLKGAAIYFSGREVDLTKFGGNGKITIPLTFFPSEVAWTFTALVQICHILSHDEEKQQPSMYALESAIYGLCTIVLCFKNFIITNYKIK
jgi:hypothetical protein